MSAYEESALVYVLVVSVGTTNVTQKLALKRNKGGVYYPGTSYKIAREAG